MNWSSLCTIEYLQTLYRVDASSDDLDSFKTTESSGSLNGITDALLHYLGAFVVSPAVFSQETENEEF